MSWEDPLLIPLDGHPIRLTGVRNGVLFDVNGDGIPDRVAWTMPGAPVGLLVFDQNGNGVVDGQGELFGQAVTGRRHPARLRQGYGGSAVAPPSPMGLWRGGGGKVPPTASRTSRPSTGRRTAATATG